MGWARSVCVVDGHGRIVREAKVASVPEALVVFCKELGVQLTRIGLEAGRCRNGFTLAYQGPTSTWCCSRPGRSRWRSFRPSRSRRRDAEAGEADRRQEPRSRRLARRLLSDGMLWQPQARTTDGSTKLVARMITRGLESRYFMPAFPTFCSVVVRCLLQQLYQPLCVAHGVIGDHGVVEIGCDIPSGPPLGDEPAGPIR